MLVATRFVKLVFSATDVIVTYIIYGGNGSLDVRNPLKVLRPHDLPYLVSVNQTISAAFGIIFRVIRIFLT